MAHADSFDSGFQESSMQTGHKARTMPHSIEAEQSVLGGILLNNEALNQVADVVRAGDFYRPAHGAIYEAIVKLAEKGEPVDEVTVVNALREMGKLELAGGPLAVSTLVERIPTAANILTYARIVRQKAIARNLIMAATEIVTDGYEDTGDIDALLDKAERTIFEINDSREKRGLTHAKDIVKDAFRRIEKLYERREAVTGVPTGFDELDKMTAGLQPSDLLILAARPAIGKTALALSLAANSAIRHKKSVAVFSLEMSKEQLVMRLLCSEGRIDGTRMRGGFLSENDWPRLARAAGAISEAPLLIDDSGVLTVLDLRAKCRRLKAENMLDLIVIDYLQLMQGPPNIDSREQQISAISRGLKQLAKELNVPIMALSQLNRGVEQRADKRPMTSDLRESGAIEQDADIIMFIYRDEVYNPETPDKGVAEVIIAKQRNGPTGTVKLKFFNEYTRYENLAVSRE
jgi:replicative DNA helicase